MVSWLRAITILLLAHNLSSCQGQYPSNSGPGETLSEDFGQRQPFAYKMPRTLSSSDTSPSWYHEGQKIIITGYIYQRDGLTPASDVILYYYQTDAQGTYSTDPDHPRNMPKNKLGQTHGYIRGWIQTNEDGKYVIRTGLPGSYPNRNAAAHIHVTVQEANMPEPYYLDNFVFDHDQLLSKEKRTQLENRGGSGIIHFIKKEDIWIGERDIILGLNIPNYTR